MHILVKSILENGGETFNEACEYYFIPQEELDDPEGWFEDFFPPKPKTNLDKVIFAVEMAHDKLINQHSKLLTTVPADEMPRAVRILISIVDKFQKITEAKGNVILSKILLKWQPSDDKDINLDKKIEDIIYNDLGTDDPQHWIHHTDSKKSNLAKARAVAGLSQQELADVIGSNVSNVSSWERGVRDISKANADMVLAMAKTLNTTVEYLIS